MATTNGRDVKEQVQAERLRRRKDARIEHVRKRAKHERTITEFQPDAVEIEERSVPGGARWTLYTVIALMVAFVLWSCWAEVDEIVKGQGKLITTESTVVVQSFQSAPIHSIDVRFGQRVKAGQVVATLDNTFSKADQSQLNAQMNSVSATIGRLTAELEGTEFSITGHENDRDWKTQSTLFRERKSSFRAELEKFGADIEKLKVRMQNTQSDILFAEQEVGKYKEVEATRKRLAARDSMSPVQVMSAELQRLTSQKTLLNSRNALREWTADLKAKGKERNSFVANQRAQIADELLKANQELSTIEQEINKANRMGELLELKVPTDSGHDEFVVFEVAELSVGSILQQGQPLFKLIPVDVPLEAEVEVAGRDVAKVRVLDELPADGKMPSGTRVTLKLTAFDYQDHGTLSGYVRTVSEGVFEKQGQPGAGGGPPATFKARVRLIEPTMLENVPSDFRLMPGMSTTAEIKVGKRRVIQYFLYPLLRYLDEGFREP